MAWPLILNGKVVQIAPEKFDVTPPLIWGPACPDGTKAGDTFDGTAFAHPAPSWPPQSAPVYVPLATIRDRVTAAGKWMAFAAALDSLPSDKRWHLLTLTQGVAPNDADAIALLTAVGCDPAVVLAP